jgi:hypothetical protein
LHPLPILSANLHPRQLNLIARRTLEIRIPMF